MNLDATTVTAALQTVLAALQAGILRVDGVAVASALSIGVKAAKGQRGGKSATERSRECRARKALQRNGQTVAYPLHQPVASVAKPLQPVAATLPVASPLQTVASVAGFDENAEKQGFLPVAETVALPVACVARALSVSDSLSLNLDPKCKLERETREAATLQPVACNGNATPVAPVATKPRRAPSLANPNASRMADTWRPHALDHAMIVATATDVVGKLGLAMPAHEIESIVTVAEAIALPDFVGYWPERTDKAASKTETGWRAAWRSFVMRKVGDELGKRTRQAQRPTGPSPAWKQRKDALSVVQRTPQNQEDYGVDC